MDLFEKVIELARSGYHCSQIIMILTLATIGEENPALVKSLCGLGGGVGFSGDTCGCVTGSMCALSYFMGKEAPEDHEHMEHREALGEFLKWFEAYTTENFGCSKCMGITGLDRAKIVEKCPTLIAESYAKCMDILSERGFLE